jgi:hypothetical protein
MPTATAIALPNIALIKYGQWKPSIHPYRQAGVGRKCEVCDNRSYMSNIRSEIIYCTIALLQSCCGNYYSDNIRLKGF